MFSDPVLALHAVTQHWFVLPLWLRRLGASALAAPLLVSAPCYAQEPQPAAEAPAELQVPGPPVTAVQAPPPSQPQASDPAWSAAVLPPDPNVIVDLPPPSGMPTTVPRRSGELSISTGVALLTCRSMAPGCSVDAGGFVALALVHRPAPWFSWGGEFDAMQLGQTWVFDAEQWSLRQRSLTGRILANVHLTSFERIDPYIGLALGGGALRDTYGQRDKKALSQWVGSPLYAARVGLNVHMTDRVRLGGMVDWTSLLVNTGEYCPWTAGGVCTSSDWGAFPPDNAVWKAGLSVSITFGQEL